MVVAVDVVIRLDLQLVQRREVLPVDEPGLQYLVRRLVDRVAVRAALPREGPFVSECPRRSSMAMLSNSLPLSV